VIWTSKLASKSKRTSDRAGDGAIEEGGGKTREIGPVLAAFSRCDKLVDGRLTRAVCAINILMLSNAVLC
jgi:hypothetical protein